MSVVILGGNECMERRYRETTSDAMKAGYEEYMVEDECRAWTIRKGTKAPQAAGKIHSDIERGFIRAETINFDEMMACGGSVAAAKEKGLLRSEGKEYVVKDGDMIYFRFNV